jgi:hypothetical protein
VDGGTGADKQRTVFQKRGSTEDVARYLAEATA